MNWDVLRNEVLNDPLARGYATMTPQQVAASLNTKNRQVVRSTMANARTVMAKLGPDAGAAVLDKLQAAASQSSSVKWAMSFVTSPEGIDLGNPATRAQLDALAAAGVITQQEATSLKSIAEYTVSRAEELGLSEVLPWQVAHVRGM